MPKEIIKEIVAYTVLVRRMGKDPRLLATHVSLFTAMFVCWQRNGFIQPFSVCRRELMAFSKIASVATYHKCIRDLDNNGLSAICHPIIQRQAALFIGLVANATY